MDKPSSPRSVRTHWGDFPPVVTLLPRYTLKNFNSELYAAAKSGNGAGALLIVEQAVTNEALSPLVEALAGRKPIVAPVLAEEATGCNQLPVAFACLLEESLGLSWTSEFVQCVRANHTGAGAFERIARQPVFDGAVEAGADYLIVDDTVTMGGTLAALRGHIESHGGRVLMAACLNGGLRQTEIRPTADMLATTKAKHPHLSNWWRDEYGFDVDALTGSELGTLRKAASLDEIKEKLRLARGDDAASRAPEMGTTPFFMTEVEITTVRSEAEITRILASELRARDAVIQGVMCQIDFGSELHSGCGAVVFGTISDATTHGCAKCCGLYEVEISRISERLVVGEFDSNLIVGYVRADAFTASSPLPPRGLHIHSTKARAGQGDQDAVSRVHVRRTKVALEPFRERFIYEDLETELKAEDERHKGA